MQFFNIFRTSRKYTLLPKHKFVLPSDSADKLRKKNKNYCHHLETHVEILIFI